MRLALRLALVLLAAACLFEGLVRGMLFRGWFTAYPPIGALRTPFAFAGPFEDELYELRARLESAREPHQPHAELGWLPPEVGSSYSHARRLELGGERPVLLFGDSFAGGVLPKESFQVLFEDTRLGPGMELVNYGCGGYGLDQIQMLAERALPLWTEYDPVVLISLLVDDDLDRCRLSIHPWPKPRYRLDGDELVLERAVIPTLEEHLAEAFPLAKSWAWRLLLHGGLVPEELGEDLCGGRADDREVQALSARLLEEIIADLRALHLTFGFVLFYSLPAVEDPAVLGWRETGVLEVLDRERVPYVLTRGRLARHMAANGRPAGDYYYLSGNLRNHLTTLGNRIVLEDLLSLVERLTAGAPPYVAPPAVLSLAEFERSVLPGKHSEVKFLKHRRQLALRAGSGEPTEVHYAIGEVTRLRFDAWVPLEGPGGGPVEGREPRAKSGELRVLVDGRELLAVRIESGAPPQSLELDVAGAESVVLQVANTGPSPWLFVCLDDGVAR